MGIGESPPVASASVAEALAEAPFFAGLSAVEVARLVPDLAERHFEPGERVYRHGDPGDELYLIRSGRVELSVPTGDGAQSVRVLEPPAYFGETTLLTDAPREADVVALTPLTVLALPRARFESLVQQHPRLPLRIAAEVATRLAETTQRLSETQEQVAAVARVAYGSLSPATQALLRRTAFFAEFDRPLLCELLGPDWSDEAFEEALREAVFFHPVEREGSYRFTQESIRGFLVHQLQAEVGAQGLVGWYRRAADMLLARPAADPGEVARLLAAAADWRRLGRLLEERGGELVGCAPERVEGYLRALPKRQFWRRGRLVRLLAECCAAQGKPEQAVEVYLEAERRDPGARRGPLALEYQRCLAALYDRLGDADCSLACRRRIDELRSELPDGEHDEANAQLQTDLPPAAERAGQPGHGRDEPDERGALLGALAALVGGGGVSIRWLATLAILGLTALAWTLPPPPGLSPPGLRVLATILALVGLSFLDVLPDYLLGLLMIAAWIVSGTLPPEVAASGFASSTWFLMLATMAIGAAVARSGLLYRAAIEIVRRLPPSHAVRCLTLGALGLLCSPGMPSVSGRIMLAAPLAQDIADSLRYSERSNGSAGLGLATLVGFGMLGPLFLTGSPGSLILYGLLPTDVQARMTWGAWFLAALPTVLVLFGLSMAFLLLRYRPETESGPPAETLALQRRVLGRLSRHEWTALVVLVLLLLGFSTQALHRLDPAWLAVAAVGVLFLAGALDEGGFREGVDVSFLLYLGVILGFGQIFSHVGLDRWLGAQLEGLATWTRGNPTLFVLAVAVVSIVLSLLLRPGSISILLLLALAPTAASLGVSPWIVALTALLATNIWVYPQQNMLYLAAYHATAERAFTHAQARPLAIFYPVAVLLAILVSIPYWKLLGLIG